MKIGQEELDNVYSFIYLGAEIPSDGNPEVPIVHRRNIAWGAFNNNRRIFTAAKLPVAMRLRLYRTLVVSTMLYGCKAWMFTDTMRKRVNGANSKMLAQITRRSIHQEAQSPTFCAVEHALTRRWEYLGHILRLDDHRALKQFVINLSPAFPYQDGSLLSDTIFRSIGEMQTAASDRKEWREGRKRWSR